MIKSYYKKVKTHFKKAANTNSSPNNIAASFALGTFLAILPIGFFSIFIGAFIAVLFKETNKIALALSFIIWNPFINTALIVPAVKLGEFVITYFNIPMIQNVIVENVQKYVIGISVLALAIATISFFTLRLVIEIYKRRR